MIADTRVSSPVQTLTVKQAPEPVEEKAESLQEWLSEMGCADVADMLVKEGFDSWEFIQQCDYDEKRDLEALLLNPELPKSNVLQLAQAAPLRYGYRRRAVAAHYPGDCARDQSQGPVPPITAIPL